MPLEHNLTRLRSHIQPIHRVHHPGHNTQPGSTSPKLSPVQRHEGLERGVFEGGEQGRAEFKVQREETEGDEGRVGEEDWELA
jgi:hypothetical protein